MPVPRATYRIQLRPEFDLDAAAAQVDYLAALGVSHVYASPYLQAAHASAHGYDVVDPTAVNVELGGEDARARFVAALDANGMGHVLDIVPNHMAIPGRANAWWWDVLRLGRASRYADYFDVDWEAPSARDRGVIVLPVLGDHYGRVLERGELVVAQDDQGEWVVRYFDQEFPLDPSTTDELAASSAPDADTIDALLGAQHFRLAYWRLAESELDYRRFFDISSLIGVRVELPHVFAATHSRVLGWLADGSLDGVRVDHVDGLRDPAGYLARLRERAGPEAWIVVEKILEGPERLPSTWPVAGTTGYDVMARLADAFIDPSGAEEVRSVYDRFVGGAPEWPVLRRAAKRHVVERVLRSDVERLTGLLDEIAWDRRRLRDFTREQLRAAIGDLLVELPVYRTYVRAGSGGATQADVEVLEAAARSVRDHTDEIDDELLDFVVDLLAGRATNGGDAKEQVPEDEFVARFQQLSGPVMAKGVEDTAFYRYHALVARNEVGNDPGRGPWSVDDLHERFAELQRGWPQAMIATSTHDTKRSEDVRARLAVLSEVPDEWDDAVTTWSRLAERHLRPAPGGGRSWPEKETVYLVLQTLVGAHPLSADRAATFVRKAVKEAKLTTSWTDPDPAYDDAVDAFVRATVADAELATSIDAFVDRIRVSGWRNALAMAVLKLVAPGVPDFYQGTELWDLSLVDPDNRRPVDFAQRRRLLSDIGELDAAEIWARRDEGLPKLHVVRSLLHLRSERPEVFGPNGTYRAIRAVGPAADRLVCCSRSDDVVALVPRCWHRLDRGALEATSLEIPAGRWVDVLTGDRWEGGRPRPVTDLLDRFPVAVFAAER